MLTGPPVGTGDCPVVGAVHDLDARMMRVSSAVGVVGVPAGRQVEPTVGAVVDTAVRPLDRGRAAVKHQIPIRAVAVRRPFAGVDVDRLALRQVDPVVDRLGDNTSTHHDRGDIHLVEVEIAPTVDGVQPNPFLAVAAVTNVTSRGLRDCSHRYIPLCQRAKLGKTPIFIAI